MVFLERAAEHLRARHAVGTLVRVTKANPSAPARSEDAALLVAQCAAVVTAIGD